MSKDKRKESLFDIIFTFKAIDRIEAIKIRNELR